MRLDNRKAVATPSTGTFPPGIVMYLIVNFKILVDSNFVSWIALDDLDECYALNVSETR